MAIVTISRQVGSLGDELAQQLALELGYHLVSARDIRELAAGYDPAFAGAVKDLEQESGMGLLERLFFGQPVYTSLYEAVILELASRRQTIIIGRGAQIVLKEVPEVVRARVVAPSRVRAARVGQALSLGPEQARDYIERHGQERRALIRQIFDHDLKDWGLYNLVLNTEGLDLAASVAIVGKLVEEVVRLHPLKQVAERLALMALAKRIEATLRRELLRSKVLKADAAPDGSIVLSGYLHSKRELAQAGQLAQGMAGERAVVNQIKETTFAPWPA